MSCNFNKDQQYNEIAGILNNPGYGLLDKLKLIGIFSLRYENDKKV